MNGPMRVLYIEWDLCLQSVLLRGKLAEGILQTYEKGVVYWSISSLTRLGPFLG